MASSLWLHLKEFEAIAPRIFGEEATSAGEGKVVGDLDAASEQCLPELVEIGNGESGMRFFRGTEVFFYADVELLSAALEPAAAARTQRGGLF